MALRLFTVVASLLLCVAVCVLWVRSRTGYDQAVWAHDRWLPGGSAASNQVQFLSDTRLWVTITAGRAGPPNGQLAWGYYVNADQSHGRPRLWFEHDRYGRVGLWPPPDEPGTSGWGPLRWKRQTRTAKRDGDDSSTVLVGVSHWFAAGLLAILPARAGWRAVGRWRRRALRRHGHCRNCGYDLRATPERCPECGTLVSSIR